MPATSLNQPVDEPTQSTDVIVTIDIPEEPLSTTPQGQHLDNDTPSPAPVEAVSEEDNKEEEQAECRICLMSDEVDQLIKPCHCIGSVQYAHLKCLKLWIHETADLHCEICKEKYNDSLIPELEADLLIGLEERNRRNNGRRLRHQQQLHGGRGESVGGTAMAAAAAAAAIREQEAQENNVRRFWMRALFLTIPITVLIIMLLFLGIHASDSQWAAILLRILAFALPTFIVLRIVFGCWDVARFGRGHGDDIVRRDAGV